MISFLACLSFLSLGHATSILKMELISASPWYQTGRDDESMSVNRILERLQQEENKDPLVRHLVRHHRNDPKVIEYYRKKLSTCSPEAYYALVVSPDDAPSNAPRPGIWDPSYPGLLADCFTKDKTHTNTIYDLLDRHKKEWRNDVKVTAKLLATVKKNYPMLVQNKWENLKQQSSGLGDDEMDQLAYGLIWLGRTCDKDALPYLEKGLQLKITLRPMPQACAGDIFRYRANSIAECAALGIQIWTSDQSAMPAWPSKPEETIKKAQNLLSLARKTANTDK